MSTPAPAPKQQLKLKLSRHSPASDPNTPSARNSATPGVIVDNEALVRQQRHVMDSMGGNRSSHPPSSGKAGTPVAPSNPFTGQAGCAVTCSERYPTSKHGAREPSFSPQRSDTNTASDHGSTAGYLSAGKWQSTPQWPRSAERQLCRTISTTDVLCSSTSDPC
jgi:hypothetical protein